MFGDAMAKDVYLMHALTERVSKGWNISETFQEFWRLSRNFGGFPGIFQEFWRLSRNFGRRDGEHHHLDLSH